MNNMIAYVVATIVVVGPVLVVGFFGERAYPGYGYLFSTFASLCIGMIGYLLRAGSNK